MPRPSLRDAIVAAAEQEFHTHGFHATGVAAITAAAGAPKGSFYNHFASKEELALEVLDRYAARMRVVMLSDPDVAPLDRVRAHFAFLASELAAHDYRRGCLLGNFSAETGAQDAQVARRASQLLEHWSDTLRATIRDAQADGSVPGSVDAEVVAYELIDLYEGAAMRSKPTGDGAAVHRAISHALPRLLELDRC